MSERTKAGFRLDGRISDSSQRMPSVTGRQCTSIAQLCVTSAFSCVSTLDVDTEAACVLLRCLRCAVEFLSRSGRQQEAR